MIDLHTHILYELDDGSHSREMTLSMLRIALESGTTHLVATPHADPDYHFQPELIQTQLESLRGVTSLNLYSGCDFHLSHDNLTAALARPRRYTINQGIYLLIELSNFIIFPNTADLYTRLEDVGLRIILTHPERNPLLRQRPELIEQWVSQGRYMQVTAQSLTGDFGGKVQRFSRWLMDRGLVHFVASDAHDPEHRPPRLDLARRWVESRYGEPWARLLFEVHPLAALESQPLDMAGYPPPRPEPARFAWLSRWFKS